MGFKDIFYKQVELLVRTLPHVATEACFALKGGTAINLFLRDMPRLSVDIDLTYLPEADRAQALREIDAALRRIAGKIQKSDAAIRVTLSAPASQDTINKLIIRNRDQVQIKVEVTPVLRGCVYPPVVMPIVEKAENIFGFAQINTLSFEDLYAGKIAAALDRQHPRDLFDVAQLFANEGLTDKLRTALIVYIISHDTSPHALLNPKLADIKQDYEQNFAGMADNDIGLAALLDVRLKLIHEVVAGMPKEHKEFLLSFYIRQPKWDLLGIKNVSQLPAVRWREVNLDKAGKGTQEELVRKLKRVLL